MKKLSKKEIGKLGIYEFQGYIGAMTSPTFGGWKGTNRLLELLELEAIEKPNILELGCSTGYITKYVAEKFNCTITGVDLSDFLIKIAEKETSNLSNITFQSANVESLPFPDNTFDIIYGEAITALVPNPIKALSEYKRVLKPRGKIGTLDLFMKESISKDFVEETNEIMSNVIGSSVKIRTLQEWKDLIDKPEFKSINISDYYDDVFNRGYSKSELFKIIFKMLYHLIANKEIRKKLSPTIKFAKKFKELIKGGNFGYLIFIGTK